MTAFLLKRSTCEKSQIHFKVIFRHCHFPWYCLNVAPCPSGTQRGIKQNAFSHTFRSRCVSDTCFLVCFPDTGFCHVRTQCVTMRNLHLSACLKTVKVCLCLSLSVCREVCCCALRGRPWKRGAAGSACVFREFPHVLLANCLHLRVCVFLHMGGRLHVCVFQWVRCVCAKPKLHDTKTLETQICAVKKDQLSEFNRIGTQ